MTTQHPKQDQATRLAELRRVLRPLNTDEMETEQVAAACLNAVPEASIDEIVQALRQVAGEHMTEAEQL